ncbi:hypothetical protein FOMG_08737 [Fusarium oxysporum f. sp. melonis 26406]|uniref:Heterokaryon incompatibility domain-containing protein n=1 Tax=Fusarium oxysporum f. sp. melonis 26406 TaxID=1089452 RepID=X0A2G8_FUSOX|nr:hypothetical protein FOMG_08737 [Fusarium oxysporum f. sp. melonis 26406]
MRLLEYRDGKFKLTKYFVQNLPRYAILSHTWGPDAEEVTFKDLVDGTGENKIGYEKIRFCAGQTGRDGLEYFWIDTCCIDKSNNNELSTAINSMFRWYQNAARCYVYLSGILAADYRSGQQSGLALESALQAHRWFTRGWTLQELLAPASVEFFTQDGLRLGDKKSLEQQIHETTGIAIQALRERDLAQFDVKERFRWADKRQTTHEEDWAYCLLGIFGIFMPLIYGEGKEHAIRRLKNEINAKSREDVSNRQGGPLLARFLTTSLMADWKWKPFVFCVLILGLAILVKQEVTRRDLASIVSRPAAVYLANQRRSGSDLEQTALVPYASNPDFVGRSRILEQLKGEFGFCQPQGDIILHKRVALFGLGGVGNTQIALAYVYWLQEKCPEVSIFWVNASSVERFNQSYAFIAQELQVPGYNDPKVDVVLLVKRWLEKKQGRWLMVIDNADETHLFKQSVESASTSAFGKQGTLERYLPDCIRGSILVTTRNKQAAIRLSQGRYQIEVRKMDETRRQIEVRKMDESGPEQLLRTRIEGDVTSGELSELSSRLEYLPLALVQTAAFIQENTISVKEYVQLLSRSDKQLTDLLSEEFETVGRDLEASRAVAEMWVLSFEQIHQLNLLASELLSPISFFDRHIIPLEFLTYYDKSQKEPKGEILLIKAIGVLKAFSFVSEGRDHTLDRHRLVQLVTRAWLAKKSMMRHFAGKALLKVSGSYPICNPFGNFEKQTICMTYLPHVNVVLELEGTNAKEEELA